MIASRVSLGLSGGVGFSGSIGRERALAFGGAWESWLSSGLVISSVSMGGLSGVGRCVGSLSFNEGACRGVLMGALGGSGLSGVQLSEFVSLIVGVLFRGSYVLEGTSPLVGLGTFQVLGVVGDESSLRVGLLGALGGGVYSEKLVEGLAKGLVGCVGLGVGNGLVLGGGVLGGGTFPNEPLRVVGILS